MKFVLIEFIDEFESFQAFCAKSGQTMDGFTLIALEPRLQAYLKTKGVAYRTTLPYFTNDSHKRILVESERIMEHLRAHFTFTDHNGLSNCYSFELTFYIRFYLNHLLKMIEVLEHIHAEDRHCELFASVDHNRTPQVMINDAERYVGSLAERFAQARGLTFTNFKEPAAVTADRTRAASNRKGSSWLARPASQTIRFLLRKKKVIFVPLGSGAFKDLLAQVHAKDRKIVFLAIGSAAAPLTSFGFNLYSLVRSFFDPRYVPYYLMDSERLYRPSADEQLRLSSSVEAAVRLQDGVLFSYQGVDYTDLIVEKIAIGLQPHMARTLAQSGNLQQLFSAFPHSLVLSFLAHGIMAVAGELAKRSEIPSLFISHGAHPVPVDAFHEIELVNLCRGFMLSDYTRVALSTPVQEEHLHYFKKKYAWVRNTELRTGPLMFADISNADRIVAKNRLGLSPEDVVITHATTTKARQSERYHFLETFDELFSSISDIISILDGTMRLVLRIHPGFYLSDDEIRSLLPGSPRLIINRTGSFADVLAATDILISYSSTTIDEALLNRVPVLLYDPWKRYRHFSADRSPDQFPVAYIDDKAGVHHAICAIMGRLKATRREDIDVSRYRYDKDYKQNFFDFVEASLRTRT